MQSCAFRCVQGTGEIVTREVDIDLFQEFDAASTVDVELKYGQNQKVEVTGYDNLINLLETEVRRGKWNIDFQENICSEDMLIRITMSELEGITISGTGDVRTLSPFEQEEMELEISGTGDLDADVNTDQLDIEIRGTGNMTLRGFADKMSIESSGTGNLHAEELEAKQAEVENSGTGDVYIRVTEELEIEASGTGDTEYYGTPASVRTDNSGVGEIISH
jgi:hypothetical protein